MQGKATLCFLYVSQCLECGLTWDELYCIIISFDQFHYWFTKKGLIWECIWNSRRIKNIVRLLLEVRIIYLAALKFKSLINLNLSAKNGFWFIFYLKKRAKSTHKTTELMNDSSNPSHNSCLITFLRQTLSIYNFKLIINCREVATAINLFYMQRQCCE